MSNQEIPNKTSRFLVASIGLSFAIQIASGGFAWAGGFADCVRDAAARDLVAKTEFQRDLRDLVVQNRPEFETIATVSMELQVLLAEARRAKFDYLLRHDPDRIDTSHELARFLNFEWFDEDSARFRGESSAYRELEDRISALQEQNNGDPDWPKMREHFRSDIGQSPDFKALVTLLQTRQSNMEAMIAQCPHE